MPKNPVTVTIKRWQEIDKALRGWGPYHFGLNVREFARQMGVTEKTITRDLKDFEDMGQKIERHWDEDWEAYFWLYGPTTRPLFISNMPSWVRDVAFCRRCQAFHARGHRN